MAGAGTHRDRSFRWGRGSGSEALRSSAVPAKPAWRKGKITTSVQMTLLKHKNPSKIFGRRLLKKSRWILL